MSAISTQFLPLTLRTAPRSAWRAFYIYTSAFAGRSYPGRQRLRELRLSFGIDSGVGSSYGRARAFGSFGRWSFGFRLPAIPWIFVCRHRWAMPLYKLQESLRHRLDGRFAA